MPAERLSLDFVLTRGAFELQIERELDLSGITAVYGPSGSGKTTLLRVLAGLERPDRGQVSFGGERWFDAAALIDRPAHRRPVGMVFQEARLFSHLDVAGNLRFAVKRRRRSETAAVDWDDVVSVFDLQRLLPRTIDGLSGGERQRVAIARTLLTGPRLLLLDEPLSALDVSRKHEILPYLESLPRRFDLPILYVTHSIDEVARLADRTLALAAGRVRGFGPTEQVLGDPAVQSLTGRFEAGVLLHGLIEKHDDAYDLTRVLVAGQTLVLPRVARAEAGQSIRLRVRARDVALALRRPESISIRNVLRARVEAVEIESSGPYCEVGLSLVRQGVDESTAPSWRLGARLTRAAVDALELRPGLELFALVKSVSFDGADD